MVNDAALVLTALAAVASGCGDEDVQACYSPTANVALAGQNGAKGCPCNSAIDKAVCVEGKALFCDYDHWSFGYDGPCMPVRDGGSGQDLMSVDATDANDARDVSSVDTRDAGDANDLPSLDIGADVGNLDTSVDGAVDVSPVDTGAVDTGLACTIDSGCPTGSTCNAGQCQACFTTVLHPELVTMGSTRGCPCNESPGPGMCFKGIGIVCLYGRWMTVLDGPCMPIDAGRGE